MHSFVIVKEDAESFCWFLKEEIEKKLLTTIFAKCKRKYGIEKDGHHERQHCPRVCTQNAQKYVIKQKRTTHRLVKKRGKGRKRENV